MSYVFLVPFFVAPPHCVLVGSGSFHLWAWQVLTNVDHSVRSATVTKVEVFQSRLVMKSGFMQAETKLDEKKKKRQANEEVKAHAPANIKTVAQKNRYLSRVHQAEQLVAAAAAERRGEKTKTQRRRPGVCHIVQHNVGSIAGLAMRTKLAEVRRRLKEHDPDVAVLLETWLRPGVDETPDFPGYAVHRVDRPARKGQDFTVAGQHRHGGGIIILVAEGIQWTSRTITPPPPPQKRKQTIEIAAVRIFPEKAPTLDVCAVYNPPTGRTHLDLDLSGGWIPRRAVVCMDANIHHPSWDTHCGQRLLGEGAVCTRRLLKWVTEQGARILNDGSATFTRPTEAATRSAPDLTIATPFWASRARWKSVEDWGTEHRAIVTEVVTGGKLRTQPKRAPKWRLKDADWPAYTAATERALRQTSARTADELHKALTEAILAAAREHIGLSEPKNPRKARCWWTPEAARAVEVRRALRKQAERSGRPEDVAAWRHAERRCKKIICEGKRRSWRDYITELEAEENNTDKMAKIWRMKEKLAGKPQTFSRMRPIREESVQSDGTRTEKLLTRDVDKAEAFARGYAEVSQAKVRPGRSAPAPRQTPEDPAAAPLCTPFTLSELQHVLRRLRPGKAAGTDTIPSEMLQHLGPRGEKYLLRLANRSWARAEVPRPWRSAEVVPLPKPGRDPSIRKSYRPISLTSSVSKAVERLVKNRVQEYLERRRLLAPEQAGYRTARSVEEHCVRLSQHIHDGRARDHHTVLLSVDATAAFDRMIKARLYEKMRAKGLPERVVTWFRAFLADRKARVRVDGTCSRYHTFEEGCPQGTVLGPLCWLIFIDDLPERLRPLGGELFVYADDVCVAFQGPDLAEQYKRAQRALDLLRPWAEENGVEVSMAKTCATAFPAPSWLARRAREAAA
eukprot:gene8079-20250_t